jgi:regulator of sigma E protease
MSWVLAVLGFIVLIVLHEAGHFLAAKAVGMRVERFSLFFPPHVAKWRRGETEYALGTIPAGGYVKITGMNPREELDPEVADRAYYRQPAWKRIVVILAGPAMNVVLAFLILWVLFANFPTFAPTSRVASENLRAPASQALRPGDLLVSVDGRRGDAEQLREQIATHRCPGEQVQGCVASPARVVVERDGRLLTFRLSPRYEASEQRPLLGFAFDVRRIDLGAAGAAVYSVNRMGEITTKTLSVLARVFDSEQRKQISGIVGSSKALSDSFQVDLIQALGLLGIISLSLAIVNLFPFLPLDGGHVFWALAEKVRGKPISFDVMERSMAVGFVLVLALFVIGLNNDIGRLTDGTFPTR